MEVLVRVKLDLPEETYNLLGKMAAEAGLTVKELALIAVNNFIGVWLTQKQKN